MPEHDDDDLAALEFDPREASVHDDDLAVLEFDAGEASARDVDLTSDAVDTQTEATAEESAGAEAGPQLFTVANPPDTVSVSALIDGRTQRVDLSPKATGMTESELAEEVAVLADLARRKGLGGQHNLLRERFKEAGDVTGVDGNRVLGDMIERGLELPTPEQASTAQAEVFATRYTDK